MDCTPSARTTRPVAAGPSQTTAAVIRFSCLFTYDIKRKAKRWQDGFLRFHTFNRRVMVYGTSGDFVGDLHMRESSTVRDGDQLELERGVLVEVGECLEKTETDLTELLEKRKTNSTASPARTMIQQTPAAAAAAAGVVANPARPKSLNELLGKNRGPLGRAVLPRKSPFQLQRENDQDQHDHAAERPTKRRKLSPVVERQREGDASIASKNLERISARKINDGGSTGINLASTTKPNQNDTSGGFQPASALKITSSSRAEHGRKGSKKALLGNQKAITAMFHGDKRNITFPSPVENPRKKLMCLEISKKPKTGKKPAQRESTGSSWNTSIPGGGIEPSSSSSVTPLGGLSRSEGEKMAVLTPTGGNSPMDYIPSTSTMRVLEESFHVSEAPPSPQKATRSISDFFKPNPPPPAIQEEKENTGPSPKPPSLLRSHSDIEALAQPTESTTLLSNPAPPHRHRTAANGLQKSLSDTSALRCRSSRPSRSLQTRLMTVSGSCTPDSSRNDEEQGPWTSEALDLFDWWPPNRPKPGERGQEL
ncbi:uncharacterized protein CIMG_06133 [Coccidioides immitis RS]|uniref:5'-3' DNA helicase ZGRF1-like N-terminal domain-containing protein n=1 Tax=Coccidioides immitis (strain RS) TaxID=246410 RepID=J3K7H8_COCIM|nr:uncharacterized protein CIMG_06133 [Coccidioides immitis RS]EAS30654.3 hypothetical protein CIMG_06133 [Coccidioides immitis RS]